MDRETEAAPKEAQATNGLPDLPAADLPTGRAATRAPERVAEPPAEPRKPVSEPKERRRPSTADAAARTPSVGGRVAGRGGGIVGVDGHSPPPRRTRPRRQRSRRGRRNRRNDDDRGGRDLVLFTPLVERHAEGNRDSETLDRPDHAGTETEGDAETTPGVAAAAAGAVGRWSGRRRLPEEQTPRASGTTRNPTKPPRRPRRRRAEGDRIGSPSPPRRTPRSEQGRRPPRRDQDDRDARERRGAAVSAPSRRRSPPAAPRADFGPVAPRPGPPAARAARRAAPDHRQADGDHRARRP